MTLREKMRAIIGVYGDSAPAFAGRIREVAGEPDFINAGFMILNPNHTPIDFPTMVKGAGKLLFMNGVFLLRDVGLDGFLIDPSRHMAELLAADSRDIPNKITNGAFVGVVLEGDKLFLFNDFMALTPLYYAFENGSFVFSTSLRLLQQLLNRPWDPGAIGEYLVTGYNFSCRTPLSGIHCLPPAALACIHEGKLNVTPYACFPDDGEVVDAKHDVLEAVHAEFRKAIKRIYSPRLKYSLSLTGGMDSRLIYFEWPDRNELLTETAGEGSSDFIKARALTEELGNPERHALEDLHDESYTDGLEKFFESCDDPTKLLAEYNYHHLIWKKERGADFHLSGVGGELLNGESLYLDRKPLSVLREAFLPYSYVKLDAAAKIKLIESVLYTQYRKGNLELIGSAARGSQEAHAARIRSVLDDFIGDPRYEQSYIERFRTYMLANASFFPLHVVADDCDFLLMPYNDRDLITTISRFHPRTRELRRLELAMIRSYGLAGDIPLDSSHIRQERPYFAHKFMRTLRMVFNIGLHKKVPLFQKGEPPKDRAFKYFDHGETALRGYIRNTVCSSSIFDRKKLEDYLERIDRVEQFNFYTHHREAGNLMILFRLAMLEKNLGQRPIN